MLKQKKKTKTKRSFTLLEIMIALVILSLIGVFSGIQVKKLLDHNRFEKEIFHLFIALQEAQVLSATYQTDIQWDIFLKEDKFYTYFSTDEPFKTHEFNPQQIELSHLAELKFKDKKVQHLHFDIYSGRIEPRGVLAFYATNDDKENQMLWFDLQYGFLLNCSQQKPISFEQQLPAYRK